jgi:hypothetical protein
MDSKVPQKKSPINELGKESRKFLGKTSDFKDNRERHFYQRMLKAYLRGDKLFQFGKSWKLNSFGIQEFLPEWYPVKQSVS